jgi:hypothetical protein
VVLLEQLLEHRLVLKPRLEVHQAAVVERPHAFSEGERARERRDEVVENLAPAVPRRSQGVAPRPGPAKEARRKQEGAGEVALRRPGPPAAAGQ